MQYFIEGRTSIEIADIRAMGLGYAFGNDAPYARGTGPDGQEGVFVSRTPFIANAPAYHWEHLPCGAWFGWNDQAAPEIYARAAQLPGDWLEMANGQNWLIPTAYDFQKTESGIEANENLPRSWKKSGSEWVPGDVLPQYRRLWETAVQIGQKFFASPDEGGIRLRESDLFEAIGVALAANYHITEFEAGILGLISNSDALLATVIRTLLGIERLEELQKKT